jgi:hypothetical protein
MNTPKIQIQPSPYPSKREVIIRMIELAILHYQFGYFIGNPIPRYEINVVSECGILFLMGFDKEELREELFGFYRGLMEQTLCMEINGAQPNQTKLQAESVYTSLLIRKNFLRGIYAQQQAMIGKCRVKK